MVTRSNWPALVEMSVVTLSRIWFSGSTSRFNVMPGCDDSKSPLSCSSVFICGLPTMATLTVPLAPPAAGLAAGAVVGAAPAGAVGGAAAGLAAPRALLARGAGPGAPPAPNRAKTARGGGAGRGPGARPPQGGAQRLPPPPL